MNVFLPKMISVNNDPVRYVAGREHHSFMLRFVLSMTLMFSPVVTLLTACTSGVGKVGPSEVINEKEVLKQVKNINYNGDGTVLSSTMTSYNEIGKITRRVSYDALGSILSSTENTYNADGDLVKSTNYGPDGTVNRYSCYWYDQWGNMVVSRDYSSTDRLLEEHFETYDEDGYFIEAKDLLYDDDGAVVSGYCFVVEYDQAYRDHKWSSYRLDAELQRTLENYCLLEYDCSGHTIKVSEYLPDGSLRFYEETIYAGDLRVKEDQYSIEGGVPVLNARTEFSYNEAGQFTSIRHCFYGQYSGGDVFEDLFTYDADGVLIVRRSDSYDDGVLASYSVQEYTYW